MYLYLDTEFNGFGGALISMALVPVVGPEWYEVRKLPAVIHIHPWVAEHVVPVLGKEPIDDDVFMASLHAYLRSFNGAIVVVADWPEDIAHFCRCLCREGGWQLNLQPRFLLIDSPELDPAVPHNALADARALMEWGES